MRTNPWQLETQTRWRRTAVQSSNPIEGEDAQRPATVGEERGPFRVICEAGRDDLIQPGVLSHAWVGFERPRRTAVGGVAAAVLACSPPQQRLVKNTNARFLGEHKGKLRKESTLTESDGFKLLPSRAVEEAHGRASTSNVSGVKPPKERRASEDHVEERDSKVQKVMAAPPTEL
ncbi:hypothetical protein NDU88_004613 [Pleurodeles waltl]|uniref:Uncharacterized protein n=1 Tax=Pleurodeles waltl TaxID=8319 RepID=A0AAV7PGK5_PLEWA|nr:hypothetical protein NDU88_004613 [Pleurodeles waltl]